MLRIGLGLIFSLFYLESRALRLFFYAFSNTLVTGGFYGYLKQTVEINRSLRIKLREQQTNGMILLSRIDRGNILSLEAF